MSFIELNTVEKMLLALLRASLHQEKAESSFFSGVSVSEWRQCYQLAAKHGVMAVAWEGVMTLPVSLQPPKALKLNWGLAVEAYEKRYRHYCETVNQLSNFYAEHGIAMLQLKGVGYSHLYPVPSHREGGDIDIYTYAAEGSSLTDAEAHDLADQLIREKGIPVDTEHGVKHSIFTYQGISIENHKAFLNVERYDVAPQVERILKETMMPQPTPLEVGQVLTPSVAFNTLFISFHALGHFPGLLRLHHLYDWAVLIKRYGVQIPGEIKDRPLLNGIAAMTQLCNHFFGTTVAVEGDEKVAEMICEDMFRPKYPNDVPISNRLGILIFKTRRMMYGYRMKNAVLHYPLWKRIWGSIVSHIKEPETIFSRKHR